VFFFCLMYAEKCQHVAYSRMADIALQASYQDITTALGQPIKQTQEKGFQILWYKSQAPSEADFYFLQNGKVTLISKSYYLNPKKFSDYLSQYGNPAYSVRKAPPGTPDSLRLTVHVWPDVGHAVTTIASSQASEVIREEMFAQTTIKEYLQTYGSDLVGHSTVVIEAAPPGALPVVTQIPTQNTVTSSSGMPPGVMIIIFFFIIGILFILLKLFKKKMPLSLMKRPSDPPNTPHV